MKNHTLLHIDNIPPEQATTSSSNEISSNMMSQSVLVSSNKTSEALVMSVLLAIAVVMVKNKFGDFIHCRIILDSAFQLNLITNRVVNLLHLKCEKTNKSISAIGNDEFIVNKSVKIVIKSYHSEYSMSITTMVVPSITDYQPNIGTRKSIIL